MPSTTLIIQKGIHLKIVNHRIKRSRNKQPYYINIDGCTGDGSKIDGKGFAL